MDKSQNNPDVIIVEWQNMDGRFRMDFIVRTDCSKYRTYDVSYIHKWDNTREGLAHFLKALPLTNVKIHIEEN
jgi:hypothetical protein